MTKTKKVKQEKIEFPFVTGKSSFTINVNKEQFWQIRNYDENVDGDLGLPDQNDRIVIKDPFGSVITVNADEYLLLFNVLNAFFGEPEQEVVELEPPPAEEPKPKKGKKK